MWFITFVAIIAIVWFLYVIAQNTSESLENQREILGELKSLNAAFKETLRTTNSPVSVEQKDSPAKSESIATKNYSVIPSSDEGAESNGQININTAELNELQSLPGVGKVVAQKIIDARPFDSIDSLETVPGVSSELLNKLKPRVTT